MTICNTAPDPNAVTASIGHASVSSAFDDDDNESICSQDSKDRVKKNAGRSGNGKNRRYRTEDERLQKEKERRNANNQRERYGTFA